MPTATPIVNWDESKLRVSRPNLCNVSSTRDEVSVLLGACGNWGEGKSEVTIGEGDRIVLSPVAAKLLGDLLNNAIRNHEAQFGPLPSLAPKDQAEEVLASTPEKCEKASVILQLVDGLRVPYGYERSFKMYRQTLLTHRFLLGFNRAVAGPEVTAALPGICERLGMPPEHLAQFKENLPRAKFVHMGFEEGDKGCIYKIYEEFVDDLTAALGKQPLIPLPLLLHMGYKWDVFDSTKRTTAKYTCYPGLSLEAMRARLERIFEGPEYQVSRMLAGMLLGVASCRIPHSKMLYLEVAEDGNPRKSFDLNVYGANLLVGEIYPLLLEMCRHYGVGLDKFYATYDAVKGKKFGHVSGGVDREGRDFFTIYFGVEGRGA